MRILVLHNYYQHRGGEGVAVAAESAALRELGHEVDVHSLDNAVDLPRLNAVQLALRTIWSYSSYKRVRRLLQEKRYDVMHVHNFFPLYSPAVYDAARSCGVPVVQTLHNYRLFCMQSGLFRDGKVCERCSAVGNVLPGVRHRCYRGNFSASIVCGSMIEVHRLRKTWHKRVDLFIAVSECVKWKYVENGWDSNKILVKPNTVIPVPEIGTGGKRNFVTVGRLSDDKGLFVLLDAWAHLKRMLRAQDVPELFIIGDGPLEEELKHLIERRELSDVIKLTGRLSLDETYMAMGNATATILPSVRYEPCSRSIAESFAKGSPVIAAKIGGAVELVDDGITGFHFPPGDAIALAEKVELAMKACAGSSMRQAAREKFDRSFHPDIDATTLIKIYTSVLK
jgi:glycosyltransferase involved in cell wall biosynthesis